MPEIKDTYDQRFYIKDDKPYVRVTTVLDVLDKGVGFNKWLIQHGDNADTIRDAAAESGTRIHEACEALQRGETVRKINIIIKDGTDCASFDYSDDEWKKIIGFVNWVKEMKPEFLACEQTVYHDTLLYAGTIDIICRIDGVRYIVDIKTGNALHDTYDLQLAAYKEAYDAVATDYKRALLHLKSTTKVGYQFKEIESSQEDDFKAFTSCLNVWNWRTPDRKPRQVKELPCELKL